MPDTNNSIWNSKRAGAIRTITTSQAPIKPRLTIDYQDFGRAKHLGDNPAINTLIYMSQCFAQTQRRDLAWEYFAQTQRRDLAWEYFAQTQRRDLAFGLLNSGLIRGDWAKHSDT